MLFEEIQPREHTIYCMLMYKSHLCFLSFASTSSPYFLNNLSVTTKSLRLVKEIILAVWPSF